MLDKFSDRIIVVDDMPDMAEIISERLRLAGFQNITVYTDPCEALTAILANTRPAIVISDFNMPGLTGLDLLDEIDRQHPEIDGVLVTGNIAAATASPHRYLVINKATNFYPELISHTLSIIRSHIRPLLDSCPAAAEKPDCPFKAIRSLSIPEKSAWLTSLLPEDIPPLVRRHLACIGHEPI